MIRIALAFIACLAVSLHEAPARLAAAEAPMRIAAAPSAPTLTGPAENATLANFGPTLTWINPAVRFAAMGKKT
ncbi:MAG: hypothetical protein AAB289_13175, partial [Chloroflexota bacterium]